MAHQDPSRVPFASPTPSPSSSVASSSETIASPAADLVTNGRIRTVRRPSSAVPPTPRPSPPLPWAQHTNAPPLTVAPPRTSEGLPSLMRPFNPSNFPFAMLDAFHYPFHLSAAPSVAPSYPPYFPSAGFAPFPMAYGSPFDFRTQLPIPMPGLSFPNHQPSVPLNSGMPVAGLFTPSGLALPFQQSAFQPSNSGIQTLSAPPRLDQPQSLSQDVASSHQFQPSTRFTQSGQLHANWSNDSQFYSQTATHSSLSSVPHPRIDEPDKIETMLRAKNVDLGVSARNSSPKPHSSGPPSPQTDSLPRPKPSLRDGRGREAGAFTRPGLHQQRTVRTEVDTRSHTAGPELFDRPPLDGEDGEGDQTHAQIPPSETNPKHATEAVRTVRRRTRTSGDDRGRARDSPDSERGASRLSLPTGQLQPSEVQTRPNPSSSERAGKSEGRRLREPSKRAAASSKTSDRKPLKKKKLADSTGPSSSRKESKEFGGFEDDESERDQTGLDTADSDEEGFFQCKVPRCTQIFRSRSALRRHTKTHQKQKGYVCSIPGCGSRFAESTALKRHIRVHNGEKPYMCRYDGCNRMFADATNAKRHELTHTGEKPFYCVMGKCKKHFARRSSLKAHMIRQHGLAPDSELILRAITREPTIPPERKPPTQRALLPAPLVPPSDSACDSSQPESELIPPESPPESDSGSSDREDSRDLGRDSVDRERSSSSPRDRPQGDGVGPEGPSQRSDRDPDAAVSSIRAASPSPDTRTAQSNSIRLTSPPIGSGSAALDSTAGLAQGRGHSFLE